MATDTSLSKSPISERPWGKLTACMEELEDTELYAPEEFVQYICFSKAPNSYSVFLNIIEEFETFINECLLVKDKKYVLMDNDVIYVGRKRVKMFLFNLIIQPEAISPLLPEDLRDCLVLGDVIEQGNFKTTYYAFDKETRKAQFLKKLRNDGRELKIGSGTFSPFLMPRVVVCHMNRLYLVTNYYRGNNLYSWMKRGIEPTDVKLFFCQMVQGVRYLHNTVDICHGRLKPENIFIVNEANVWVVKITDYDLPPNPEEGLPSDEAPFEAPELVDGICGLGKEADVWCLGEVLHFMAHRYVFFTGEDRPLRIITFNALNFVGMNNNKDERSLAHLLAGMMNVNLESRMSIDAVFEHKWLTDDQYLCIRRRIHELRLKITAFRT